MKKLILFIVAFLLLCSSAFAADLTNATLWYSFDNNKGEYYGIDFAEDMERIDFDVTFPYDISSATTVKASVIHGTDLADVIKFGSFSSLCTGETLTLSRSLGSDRECYLTTIPKGSATYSWRWDGAEYDLYINNSIVGTSAGTNGPLDSLLTTSFLHFHRNLTNIKIYNGTGDLVHSYNGNGDWSDQTGNKDAIAVVPMDVSGNGYDASTIGSYASYATGNITGIVGQSYTFDGSSNFIALPNGPQADVFSISYWMKPDAITDASNRIMMSYGGSTDPRWFSGKQSGNTEFGFTLDEGTPQRKVETPTSGFNNNQWYHVVITVKAGQNEAKLYINGTLVDTYSGTITWTNPTRDFCIGVRCDLFGYYNGEIDEVGYYTGMYLNQTDVDTLYNSGAGYNPFAGVTPSADVLVVQAKNTSNAATINTFNVTLNGNTTQSTSNGTVYINVTQAGFNSSFLVNITVNASNHFGNSYTDFNISSTLVANLTEYPLIFVNDTWSGSVLSGKIKVRDSLGGFLVNRTLTSGYAYIPYNNTPLFFDTLVSNYFNKTISYTLRTDTISKANISLSQSDIKFNVTEIITNNTALGTITISGVTENSGATWNLSAGSYSGTFSKAGCIDYSFNFNVSALDNKTVQVNNVCGSVLNVTATQKYVGTVLEDFTVTYSGTNISYSGEQTATNEFATVNLLAGYEYNITVALSGYINYTALVTVTGNLTQYPVELFASNLINFNFFDEETLAPILDVNFTITSSSFGFQSNTSNGSVEFSNLLTDRFVFTYDAINYTIRNYVFRVPLETDSETNVSLYLLKDSSASDFVLTVTDKYNNAVSGLVASLLRQYVENNQTVYKVVEMMLPSVALDGATRFTAVANYVPYLFRVENADGDILFQGSGTTSDNVDTLYLIDSSIFIKVNTESSPFELAKGVNNYQYSLTNVNNASIWLSFNDVGGSTSNTYLKLYENGTLIKSTSSNQRSGTIGLSFTYNNQSNYVATATVKTSKDGLILPIDSLIIDRLDKLGVAIFGIMGWFILFLSLIVFTVGFARMIAWAIIFDVLAIIAFSSQFLGIVSLSIGIQATLLVVAVVIMYIMRDN